MFERFTDRARRIVVLAQTEAHDLNFAYIGTEHLVLGMIGEGEGVAGIVLAQLGVTAEKVRQGIEDEIGKLEKIELTGHRPFTPRLKKVLELSLREALQLGHNYIGTEHLLLAVVREGEGVAMRILYKLLGDDAVTIVRDRVLAMLSGYQGSSDTDHLNGLKPPPKAKVAFTRGRNVTSAVVVNQGDVTIVRTTVTYRDKQGNVRRKTKNWEET